MEFGLLQKLAEIYHLWAQISIVVRFDLDGNSSLSVSAENSRILTVQQRNALSNGPMSCYAYFLI